MRAESSRPAVKGALEPDGGADDESREHAHQDDDFFLREEFQVVTFRRDVDGRRLPAERVVSVKTTAGSRS